MPRPHTTGSAALHLRGTRAPAGGRRHATRLAGEVLPAGPRRSHGVAAAPASATEAAGVVAPPPPRHAEARAAAARTADT
eukprot:scaffold2631_cov412-Prasinococcus_capsulatus_cf.AAC.7